MLRCVQVPLLSVENAKESNCVNPDAHLNTSSGRLAGDKRRINAAITKLGGNVMPKLNWSAPVDAMWLSPNGLRCSNADEVLLLLKGSDRIAHDLRCIRQQAIASPGIASGSDTSGEAARMPHVTPQLVLKQFKTLDHAREFRCFVLKSHLVGISQRDPTQHFPALRDSLDGIKSAICEFHRQNTALKFSATECAPLEATHDSVTCHVA
jgi:hypothetical protein